MTTTTAGLSESLQTLIDARLDTIDRMLLGRVSRQDRVSIVREVEGQIFDLLQERDAESLERDDVLAVLARLDPPEAYVPEESGTGAAVVQQPSIRRATPAAPKGSSRVASASGILGICALGMVLLSPWVYAAAELFQSQAVFVFGLIAMASLAFVGGVSGVALAIYTRLRGVWAVVGLVTGIIAVLCALAGGGFILLGLMGSSPQVASNSRPAPGFSAPA
jgi:hypothetical protein